ncbi:hypothetical protein FB446DRAFT_142709 [Lentinula raphanica]|nr:hypothetical protein FB446DRAFT_142709 [Lentinula raphanica]
MRLLSFRLLRAVLLAVYLSNNFASALPMPAKEDVTVMGSLPSTGFFVLQLNLYAAKRDKRDPIKRCLSIQGSKEIPELKYFPNLNKIFCIPSAVSQSNQPWSLIESVQLGTMYFLDDEIRAHMFTQLQETLAVARQTSWEDIDAAIRSLAESVAFVDDMQVMQTFESTPLMAVPSKIQIVEYVTNQNDRTGNLQVQIGHIMMTFTVPNAGETGLERHQPVVFSGYVYFRDEVVMEQAVSEIRDQVLNLYQKGDNSKSAREARIPDWLERILEPEVPTNVRAWIQASKFIERLSERDSGCAYNKVPVKAMTDQTLERFKTSSEGRVESLVEQAKKAKPANAVAQLRHQQYHHE